MTYAGIYVILINISLKVGEMMGELKPEQLGKYEAHYVKKNGGVGALESLLGGIDGRDEVQEIRSIAYSMYEEFHDDKKKRIIRNIAIVSAVTMFVSFGVFLLVRYLNPIADIKLPMEIVSLTLAAICLLVLCYQFIKYEIMEHKFDNRCFNEQDEKIDITKDSDDIVMLRTRLKRLTDCVKLGCMNSYSNNLQIVKNNGKPSEIPVTRSIQNSNVDDENFCSSSSPYNDFKEENTSTWINCAGKLVLNSDHGRS